MADWWEQDQPNPSPQTQGGQWWTADTVASGQILTNPTGPAGRAVGKPVLDLPSKAAGFGAQAIASLPTEIDDRVRAFAQRRFPDMDPNAALGQYGIRDGRIFYVDPQDGQAYFEETEANVPFGAERVTGLGKFVAGGVGPMLSAIGGVIGGTTTAGFGGGIPGAAAGGAIGDAARQGLAAVTVGEDKPVLDRIMQTSLAGVEQGAGQALGGLIVKGAEKLRMVPTVPTYNAPASDRLAQGAEKFGIPLTPAEQTGNRTLLRRQKILANTTEGEEVFGEFYKLRNERVRAAVESFLGGLAPDGTYAELRRRGVTAAKDVVGMERRALQNQARPLYDEVMNPANVLDDAAFKGLSNPRLIQGEIKALRENPAYAEYDGLPDNSVAVLDAVKKRLDDKIEAARRAGENDLARRIGAAKDDLLNKLDTAFPKYGQARKVYEDGMPAVTAAEKGLVGDVAGLEATTNDALRASRILFSPTTSSATDVAQARDLFVKAGRKDEWNALVRSHLQEVFEATPESVGGNLTNIGSRFRRQVYGDGKKLGIMAEALKHEPGLARDLNWLMDVLDATGRAMKGESITAFAQAGQRELAREGKGLGPRMMESLEVWRSPSRIAQYWADVNAGKYAGRMAEIMTSPDGLKKLRELRSASPNSVKAITGVSQLLLSSTAAQAGEAIDQPRDREPAVPYGVQ